MSGWDELFEDGSVADSLMESMARLAGPERYDLDGIRHRVDDDLNARKELHCLALLDFQRRGLSPAEVMAELKRSILMAIDDAGLLVFYGNLRKRWIQYMLNAGWSVARLAAACDWPVVGINKIVEGTESEERQLRAHARAARLRRVARLTIVLDRDGTWTETHYQDELTRVLTRAGLDRSDLPDDVAYLY